MFNRVKAEGYTVEQILIERAQGGDHKAFEGLVLRHRQRLLGAMKHFIKDEQLLQDIVQEAFISAYKALPSFRGDSSFFTWLYRIAANGAKTHLAAKAKKNLFYGHEVYPQGDDVVERWLREAQDEHTPETVLMSRELLASLERTLKALPQDLREAIMLREVRGLSYEKIAGHMDCPLGTVRSRIFRAREMISQQLRPLLTEAEEKRR